MSWRKMCYIGVDFDAVLKSTDKEKNCELPDGNITVGAWRFRCATVLFQPCFTGEGASGIHVISFQTKFDDDIRKNLYANVVSSGGTVMFQGTGERMNCAEVLFQPVFIGKGASGCHGILVFQMEV